VPYGDKRSGINVEADEKGATWERQRHRERQLHLCRQWGWADKQTAIKQVKEGLELYLKDIKFDEPSETKGGAVVITGTGKAKKAGVDVTFAAGMFDAGKGQLVGAAFVADSKIEDYYKETVRGICQSIRRAEDVAK
jgi:hypothetical protein